MVFVLDDIAKIESERNINHEMDEKHVHKQVSTDILTNPGTSRVIDGVLEP